MSDDLEEDFNKEIKELLDKAADIVKQAAKIVNKEGLDILDLWDETRELRKSMDELGWSTSSLNC